jgi:hypothetical protein
MRAQIPEYAEDELMKERDQSHDGLMRATAARGSRRERASKQSCVRMGYMGRWAIEARITSR